MAENNNAVAYTLFKDSHGRQKVRGNWEHDGVTTPVEFRVDYGNHKWEDKEIMSLLRDEEVTLNDFQSKNGKVMTIKGKLGPQSYMGKEYIGFCRTDKEKTARRLPDISGIESAENQMEREG